MTERSAFFDRYDVPRETMTMFDIYAAMLVDWQACMNLIGPSTIETMWSRHFDDSAQLAALMPEATPAMTWLDIGSGAGFPALVLALLKPGVFHLVESTVKKTRFLQAVTNALGIEDRIVVHAERIEAMPQLRADVITARACAPLARLFDWGLRHGRDATWLLLKGQSAEDEVAVARQSFDFKAELISSRTDARGHIVVACDVRRSRR